MSVEFEYFRLFCSVAANLNISKAAEELHLSQPTVTKELHRLEDQLGLTLFLRHSRGVKLTPEGEYLYRRIKPAVRILLEAEAEADQLSKLETGVIRTSYNNTAAQHAFGSIINDFQDAHPNITIQSSIIPRSSLMSALNSGIVDIAFVARPGTTPIPSEESYRNENSGALSGKLAEYSLGTFDDVFLVHKHMKHLAGKPLLPGDIAQYPLIYQGNMDMDSRNHYQELIPQKALAYIRNLFIADISAIFSILTIDDYIGIVSQLSIRLFDRDSDFLPLQVSAPMLSTQYLVLYSQSRQPCLAAMKLVEYLLNNKLFTPEEIACSV